MRTLCSLLAAAFAAGPALAGGTIAGKVEATPAKYLEETVVYLKEVPGSWPPRTHALDQKGMKFLPHLLAITVNDSVRFLNSDGVDHNVYTPDGDGYNLGMLSKGRSVERTFPKPGSYSQLCSVHPEMLGYVFVGQNPFSAVVGKDGRFKIEKVPAGTWKIAVWNPQLKAAEQPVAVADGKTAEVGFSIRR